MAQVRQAPQTVQNVVTYDVVVSVDNTDLALKPGMTATTQIVIDQRDDVLRVPDQALRYMPGRPVSAASNRRASAGEQQPCLGVARRASRSRLPVTHRPRRRHLHRDRQRAT